MRKEIIILILLLGIIGIFGFIRAQNASHISGNNSSSEISEKIVLWNYTTENLSEFKTPVNYQDFIMPDNPAIQREARQLELNIGWPSFVYKNGTPFSFMPQDEGVDYWQNPDYTLQVRSGDCEDMAMLAASFLAVKKAPFMVIEGYIYDGPEPISHAWVEYYLNGVYYADSNLYSFERETEIENGIIFYNSPPLTLYSVSGPEQNITVPKMKFQPRYIFNKELKKTPYNKDWITLI